MSPLIILSRKTDDLFCSLLCHVLLISIGYQTPLGGCHPAPFYLSDLVSPLFFVNLPTKFFLRVSPPWRVSPGAVRPPSDATGKISTRRRYLELRSWEAGGVEVGCGTDVVSLMWLELDRFCDFVVLRCTQYDAQWSAELCSGLRWVSSWRYPNAIAPQESHLALCFATDVEPETLHP